MMIMLNCETNMLNATKNTKYFKIVIKTQNKQKDK